jgi:hypothetical protein
LTALGRGQIVIGFNCWYLALMSNETVIPPAETSRQLLRHTLATVAYRGGKALRGAPAGFAEFQAVETTRTPGQILAHIGDLFDWGLSMARGKQEWHDSPPLPWQQGTQRFFEALQAFDDYVASDNPLQTPADKLFQGPIADALTHIGQISILRRVAGGPVRGENYFRADIAIGRVGPDQTPPRREFD